MNGPGIQALVPTYKEHYWQERGVVIPLRRPPEGVGVGTSIPPDKRVWVDQGILQEGNMKPLEASAGDRSARGEGKGTSPLKKGGP
jgi:hypothetical protein